MSRAVRTVEHIVDDLVAVQRELESIHIDRARAEAVIDQALVRTKEATARNTALREELDAVIRRLVTHPAAPTAAA